MANKICRICRQKIKSNDKEVVLKGKVWYAHKKCFINKEIEFLDIKNVQKIADKLHQNFLDRREIKQKEHLSGLNKELYDKRDEFVKWIYSTYSLSVLPKSFFIRMNNIEKGEDKQVNEPISSEDLLMIFRLKKGYLFAYTRGKKFESNLHMFYYHFAMVLGMYDSYKKHKEKVKYEQEKIEQLQDIDNTTADYMATTVRNINNNKKEVIDFSDEE